MTDQRTDPSRYEVKDLDRVQKLLARCEDVECFSVEETIFLGNHVGAVKKFALETPYPSDFLVWCIDNLKQLK